MAYLDRMRELGFRERLVEVERDSWILIAAQMPEAVADLMTAFVSSYESAEALQQVLEMGIEEGATLAVNQIDDFLAGASV